MRKTWKRTRRGFACVLALLLVAGLVPMLPEVPRALADEVTDAIALGEDKIESAGAASLDQRVLVTQDDPAEGKDTATAEGPTLEVQSVTVSGPHAVVDLSQESGRVVTWDCVWLGSYPQGEVAPTDGVYGDLQSASWDSSGNATVGGERYHRIAESDVTINDQWTDDGYESAEYRYFRYEPIKWRVLGVDGNTALAVADVGLDDQKYNATMTPVTWETSSIRSWLNGYGASSNQPGTDYAGRSFIDAAFSPDERSAIVETEVANADNSEHGTPGGNGTNDWLFLLGEAEVYDASHGFASSCDNIDEARRCRASDYAHAMGTNRSNYGGFEGGCFWWLRSPGSYGQYAAYVDYAGRVSRNGGDTDFEYYAVRPALCIDLSSPYVQAAGTVSSNGDVDEQATTGVRDDTGDDDTGEEPGEGSSGLSGPRVKADSSMAAGRVTTWDCVWLGSYPQGEVSPTDGVYGDLQSASWDSDGDAMVGGKRYQRVSKSGVTSSGYWADDGYESAEYRYFRYEPIKWRVLGVDGNTALAVADVALDGQVYNTNSAPVTWETSSIRSWLNGYGASSNQPGTDYAGRGFMGTAFSPDERSAIVETEVENADNSSFGTPGGNGTKDAMFLLSEAQVYDASHGFASSYENFDEGRRCKATDYAHAMGVWRSNDGGCEGDCWWWLRSSGGGADCAARVEDVGRVDRYGTEVQTDDVAVRPALCIDLSSPYVQVAGTVSSNGDVDERAYTKKISSITLARVTYTYDGTAKKPGVTVKAGDETVPADGYSVTYKNNVSVGTATVTIKGKGAFSGTVKATFKIAAADVAKATVSGVKARTYTGKGLSQSPTVKVGGRTLKKGTDYAISYKNNVKAGTATMILTGKGNYKGSTKRTFKIAKATNPMVVKAVTRTAKLATVRKRAVVVAAPLKFSKKAQGKVTYVRVAKGSSKVLSVNKTSGKVTVKKGAKKGTYTIKVKVTAAGNANYKPLSKTIACKVVVK